MLYGKHPKPTRSTNAVLILQYDEKKCHTGLCCYTMNVPWWENNICHKWMCLRVVKEPLFCRLWGNKRRNSTIVCECTGWQFTRNTKISCSIKSCLTLCNPMGCRTPGFPVLHHLQEFAQTHDHWLGDSLVAQMVKNLPAVREIWAQFLSQEDCLEKGMTTHSSILAWRIPWTEEPGGLQSMGWQSLTQLSDKDQ